MRREQIVIHPAEAGERIDLFLARKTKVSRSQIQKMIGNRDVLVNGTEVAASYRVRGNDVVVIEFGEKTAGVLVPEPIPLDILYRDDQLIVVNKPPGMVVYPAAGHARGTLMNALASVCDHFASVGAPLRPGVVHRLDKDTSGVMVVALDDYAYYSLVGQFQRRSIRRSYRALVFGDLRGDEGTIDLEIGRSLTDRKKMSTRTKRGKEAWTSWKVLKRFGAATLIGVTLGTGRTHQIRVHFAAIGHPVVGDRTYGRKVSLAIRGKGLLHVPRQMLHAALLGFVHPVTGQYMEFSSPPPEDMSCTIEELRIVSPRS